MSNEYKPTLTELLTELSDEWDQFTGLISEQPPFTWVQWLIEKRLAVPFIWVVALLVLFTEMYFNGL